MSDKESHAGETGGESSLTEEAGETTAADMVSGPEDTRPVGADTMVKVGEPAEQTGKKKGGEK
ncbi:MAG: hypothetical protein ABW250_22980 [Pyrinomonadaceae bacterium]